jgi:hypothetical protein
MAAQDLGDEGGLGLGHVADGLARFGFGPEGDEIDRVSGLERDADLAVRLEPADPAPWPARGSMIMNGRLASCVVHPRARGCA